LGNWHRRSARQEANPAKWKREKTERAWFRAKAADLRQKCLEAFFLFFLHDRQRKIEIKKATENIKKK
jgi:hypothetical protein